jgi:hypothetical protein
MSTKTPPLDSPAFQRIHQKLLAERTERAKRQFLRMNQVNQWKSKVLAPMLQKVVADPDLEKRSKEFFTEHLRFEPEPLGTPKAYSGVPYPVSWKEVHPDNANITWYGPDQNTGRLGALLRTDAQGDYIAFSDLGIYFQASRDGTCLATTHANIDYGLVNCWGVGPAESSARAFLQLTVDAYTDPPQYGYASTIVETKFNVDASQPYPPNPLQCTSSGLRRRSLLRICAVSSECWNHIRDLGRRRTVHALVGPGWSAEQNHYDHFGHLLRLPMIADPSRRR